MDSHNSTETNLARRACLDTARWGAALVVAYLVLAALPAALALIVRPHGEELLIEFALGAALTGFSLATLQVVLAARFKFVDRPFGLDVVMRFHKWMGILALALLVSHPILLSVSFGTFGLLGFATPWTVNLGKLTLLIVVLGVAFALWFDKIAVEYQVWRVMHKGMIVILPLAFVHGLMLGDDLEIPAMIVFWSALLAVGLLIFCYRNAYVPFFGRLRYRVTNVQQESHDTWTVSLEPDNGDTLKRLPGQFMFLKLKRPGRRSEEHPWTISSSPTSGKVVTATIKKSGDFTETIDQTKAGDLGLIEAPFGRFSLVHHDPPECLFIAGGVGITPIRAMLAYLRDTGDPRPATLIYGNKTEDDILFRKEFESMSNRVKVVHVLSEAGDDWQGEHGFITTELIKKHAADRLEKAHVYLCGPPIMMDKIVPALSELGVPDDRIHFEYFSL